MLTPTPELLFKDTYNKGLLLLVFVEMFKVLLFIALALELVWLADVAACTKFC